MATDCQSLFSQKSSGAEKKEQYMAMALHVSNIFFSELLSHALCHCHHGEYCCCLAVKMTHPILSEMPQRFLPVGESGRQECILIPVFHQRDKTLVVVLATSAAEEDIPGYVHSGPQKIVEPPGLNFTGTCIQSSAWLGDRIALRDSLR